MTIEYLLIHNVKEDAFLVYIVNLYKMHHISLNHENQTKFNQVKLFYIEIENAAS
jgi:hypothetical protein